MLFFMLSLMPLAGARAQLFKGADIGWLSQLESWGVKYQNDNGVQQDALQILKDHGINSVRLRAFVNPSSDGYWNGWPTGFCSTSNVVSMAQRAKNMGLNVMITIHYSDHWADPGKQDKPAAWVGHTLAQLNTDVYNYTLGLMNALKNGGVTPSWVQVGNETNSGMLWPEGSTNNFANMVQLFNSGYNAIKAVFPSTAVIVHLSSGSNNGLFRWFFDNYFANSGKADVIGLSYYPYWDGVNYTQNIDALGYNLNDMVSRYGKSVMITEVGGTETNPTDTYNLVAAAISRTQAVPNGKGLGVFYWEPESNNNLTGYSLGATALVSSNTYKFTTAINAFQAVSATFPNVSATYEILNRNSGKALNVKSGSSADGAVIEQYGYGAWASQKWQLVSAGSGYYNIKNVGSGKYMDITGASTADGAQNIQWTSNGGYNQQWLFVDAGNGYWKIQNRNSGKLLDIASSSTADAALSVQMTASGSNSQQWQFISVSAAREALPVEPLLLQEQDLAEVLRIFPNPSASQATVEWTALGSVDATLRLTNMQGQTLHQKVVTRATGTVIATDYLNNGLYIVEVQAGKAGVMKKKLVILH